MTFEGNQVQLVEEKDSNYAVTGEETTDAICVVVCINTAEKEESLVEPNENLQSNFTSYSPAQPI